VTTEKDARPYRRRTYGVMGLTTSPFWHETVLNPMKRYVEIDMSGAIGEAPPPFSFFGDGPRYTTRELLDEIEYAAESREVEAILIRMGDISTSSAIADEIRQAISDFRATGKKVIVYADAPENREYYLATASDYIILMPNGYLGLNGLKIEVRFAGGTFEKLGIEPHYSRIGKYKSAAEQIAHDSFTEPSREALNAVLDDFYAKFVEDIAAGRGMSEDAVRTLIDGGPYSPGDALELGLVDRLAYWDEVPDIMDEVLDKSSSKLAYRDFAQRRAPQPQWNEPPVIGIVYGTGMILQGCNRREPMIGDIMGPRTLASALKSMREDKSVKAVIFRVDSGGGEMAAADQIRREVELTAREKPVIVSMSGVAGSGGYHIACNGTRILADDATITGSIGVINMWFHTRGLYEKLGLSKEVFWRGENADIFPSWREVTEEDLAMSRYFTDKFYDKFINDVAAGRGMTADAVHEIAQGRIWSGRKAREIGLIDEIGGLAEAIRLAREDTGISPREEVGFRVLPKPAGFWEMLTRRSGGGLTTDIKVPEPVEVLLNEAAYFELLQKEPDLYLMPYRIEVE
jgi:protease-4